MHHFPFNTLNLNIMWNISCPKLDPTYDISQFMIVTVVFYIPIVVCYFSSKYLDLHMYVDTNSLGRKLHVLFMHLSLPNQLW